MRAIHWGAAAILSSAAASMPAREAAAQTGFNGVITFNSNWHEGKPSTFVQTTSGHKVRFDGMGDKQGAMIIDGDAKVMTMIEPEQKKYFTVTEEDMKQSEAMMAPMMGKMKGTNQGQQTNPGKFSFSNTGRTETVAGVSCEVWHGVYTNEEGKQEEGDACVAKGVGLALAEMTYANPMAQRGHAGYEQFEQYRQLVGGNKGILKVTKVENGKTVTQLEATKIEPKPVSDDAFRAPAGYTEVKMGDMIRQSQNAMKQMQERMKQNQKPQ